MKPKFDKDDVSLICFYYYYDDDDPNWFREAIADEVNNDRSDNPDPLIDVCDGDRVHRFGVNLDKTFGVIFAECLGYSEEPRDVWRYCRSHENRLMGRKDYDKMKHRLEILNQMAKEGNWK